MIRQFKKAAVIDAGSPVWVPDDGPSEQAALEKPIRQNGDAVGVDQVGEIVCLYYKHLKYL